MSANKNSSKKKSRKKDKQPPWADLTMIVTHQWMIAHVQKLKGKESPTQVLSYVIDNVFPTNPQLTKLTFRASPKKHTLRATCEGVIYLYTHVVLASSNWGGPFSAPLRERKDYQLLLVSLFSRWFLLLVEDSNREAHNREIVVEVAACLHIMRLNGCELTPQVLFSLSKYYKFLVGECQRRATKYGKLRAGHEKALLNTNRTNGVSAFYMDYHLHYLAAVFLTLHLFSVEIPKSMKTYQKTGTGEAREDGESTR